MLIQLLSREIHDPYHVMCDYKKLNGVTGIIRGGR